MRMKRVLLLAVTAGTILAQTGVATDAGAARATAPPTAGSPAKRRQAPAPLRLLRRLGGVEPAAAIRLSGWGIGKRAGEQRQERASSPSRPVTETRTSMPSRTLWVTTQ